jgi:hypothetical protein
MCQRNHGAGYVTWIALPKQQLAFDAGENELVRYESSSHGSRSFCGRCGTSLLCVSTHRPEEVDVPLANLKGEIDRKPQLHIFWSDRASWTRVDDGLPRLGGATGFEPQED